MPLASAELAAGRVSYAQVRALVRVATEHDEAPWVALASSATAAQLEKIVCGVGKARGERPASDKPAVRVAWDDDGTLILTLRIAPPQAPGVLAALDSATAAEQKDRDARLAGLGAELTGQLPAGDSAESPDPRSRRRRRMRSRTSSSTHPRRGCLVRSGRSSRGAPRTKP